MILDDICILIADCPHSTAPDEGNGYPLIRTPNIGFGRFSLDGVHRVSEAVYNERTVRAVPQDNDIILAREAPAGNAAIIKNNLKFCLGQRTVLIRPNPKMVYPDYLVYYLLAPEQQYKLLSKAHGATVAHVNIPDIHSMNVNNLPDLPTQRRIASILSAYDDLIENNRRQIKLLAEAAQRLYREWFVELRFPGHEGVKVMDGVPEGWMKGTFDDICIIKKDALTPDKISPGMPYIGLEHIPRNDFCLADWGMSEEVNSNKFKFNAGDILFGKIRPYFHKVGFTICNGICSTDSIVMNANDEYYCLLLMTASSDEFVDYTYQTCKEGAKMPRADWNTMKMYPVLIPDSVLLRRFNKQISAIKDKCTVLALQNRQLTEARDRLLPKLINGEMEV